jgi:hypothetical protein
MKALKISRLFTKWEDVPEFLGPLSGSHAFIQPLPLHVINIDLAKNIANNFIKHEYHILIAFSSYEFAFDITVKY